MTHYFTFTSDTSGKFWQIDTQDTAFTVTYGKLGTTGQRQTKTFDSTDRCQQEADKLIREKTGKGYVEQIDGVAATPATPRRQGTRSAKPDQEAAEQLTARFNDLVAHTQTNQLLPFLQSLDRRLYPALQKLVRAADKYHGQYVKLTTDQQGEHWGYRGTIEQRYLITMAGLVVCELPAIRNLNHASQLLMDNRPQSLAWQILRWARPTWLGDYLLQLAQRNEWQTIAYQRLRQLETAGLVAYNPELFTRSITHYNSHGYEQAKPRREHEQYVDFLVDDPTVADREIPALFDYQADIHSCYYYTRDSDKEPYETVYIWPRVFARRLAAGTLNPQWLREQCLTVQTKDWAAPVRQFFRKQFDATQPTPADLLALQDTLLPLLAAQHPHVVSWATGWLKVVYADPAFSVPALLDWASSLMLRDDCKTALKTLVGMLEKLLKTGPAYRPAITHLLADLFAVNDMALQTKAVSLLVAYADPTDPYLQDRLQTYAGQMLGTVPEQLAAFLPTDDADSDQFPELAGTYQFAPPRPTPKLQDDRAIALPQTQNDFLFLVGTFIATDEPLDVELFMNALLLFPPTLDPNQSATFRDSLKPYEKRLSNAYFDSTVKEIVHQYWLNWLSDKSDTLLETRYQVQTLRLFADRLAHLERKRKAGSRLPLLSLPTHAPHWIAPATLVERLLAYEQAGEAIEPADLALSIARMPREQTEPALARCAGLSEPLASLMRYCLGASDTMQLPQKSLLDRVLSLGKSTEKLPHLSQLWAVAARTRHPDATFPELADSWFGPKPNVVSPFQPAYGMVEKEQTWTDWQTKELMRQTWQELGVPFDTDPRPSPILLYSNDQTLLPSTDKTNGWLWQYTYLTPLDIAAWYSLIPQYPEPLYVALVRYAAPRPEGDRPLAAGLTLMLQPGFQFRAFSLLLLGAGLLAKERETAALAAEVVIHHLSEQTLDVATLGDRLGWLLVNNYAPAQRLVGGLTLLKDVSPLHNQALVLLLENLFAQLAQPSELPRNSRKLLETYLDLLVKTSQRPATTLTTALNTWRTTGSLKKVCTELLAR